MTGLNYPEFYSLRDVSAESQQTRVPVSHGQNEKRAIVFQWDFAPYKCIFPSRKSSLFPEEHISSKKLYIDIQIHIHTYTYTPEYCKYPCLM